MTIIAKKISLLEQQPSSIIGDSVACDNYLNVVGGVEVECLIRIGTLKLTIHELRQLKSGQCLSLNQKTYEPVDVLLNNHVIARGELMSCEENFAVKITEIITS